MGVGPAVLGTAKYVAPEVLLG
eukprot:SAG11_NODE_37602_length_256_cov_0.656051_1_plen_21_part_01